MISRANSTGFYAIPSLYTPLGLYTIPGLWTLFGSHNPPSLQTLPRIGSEVLDHQRLTPSEYVRFRSPGT
jgi:hypothetical protein